MKSAIIIHNPSAGKKDRSKKELKKLVEQAGYEASYISTKKDRWEDIPGGVGLLVIAGGDGTVRKVVNKLLHLKLIDECPPLAILPIGTANNIAKTFGVTMDIQEIPANWKQPKVKKYDIGLLHHMPKHTFFLESFGYGIFPYLMMEMTKRKKEKQATDKPVDGKMQTSLKVLYEILQSYQPRMCRLSLDGKDHSGIYFLAEIMNIRSIGPNLSLSPHADPSDGLLDVVLLPEEEKTAFMDYVLQKINGKHADPYRFKALKAKSIEISWEGTHVHVDDEVIKMEKSLKIKADVKPAVFEFWI